MPPLPDGVALHPPGAADRPDPAATDQVLTEGALAFVAELQRRFGARRLELLAARDERQTAFDRGELPAFGDPASEARGGDWRVAPAPADLDDRRVEITGPCDRKMMINALNSGARVFMADLEDSLSPSWGNVVRGHANLIDAARRTIRLVDEARGRTYELGDAPATLVVRPRGWHLTEKHLTVDGEPVSAALFDAGLHLFHNAAELLARGSGPYFYLPKLESAAEARLWNEVFVFAQERLEIPTGTVRATVLIETITAAFEMEEILFELCEHAAGLNAGRWDYIFSAIKKFRARADALLPDRSRVAMTVPFMRAYAELLVQTCHRRGAHAIGGMAAFIPSRRDAEVNARAFEQVRADKEREAAQGYDGTWVAHPDLVPVAEEAFAPALGDAPNQKENLRDDLTVAAEQLLPRDVDGSITAEGVRLDVDVAIQYLDAWLGGDGAAAIYNLMEDAATAEISRAQLWQWIRHGAETDEGERIDAEMYRRVRDAELTRLRDEHGERRYGEAAELLDDLVLADGFPPFLTLPAYERLP